MLMINMLFPGGDGLQCFGFDVFICAFSAVIVCCCRGKVNWKRRLYSAMIPVCFGWCQFVLFLSSFASIMSAESACVANRNVIEICVAPLLRGFIVSTILSIVLILIYIRHERAYEKRGKSDY